MDFILFGNNLYTYFKTGSGAANGWGDAWANKFLSPAVTGVAGNDVDYRLSIPDSFAAVEIWTNTWRDIKDKQLLDPAGNTYDDQAIELLNIPLIHGNVKTSNTRPGYSQTQRRYSALQSRRVFRYQPGRISGFTFGLRSSKEKNAGYTVEWGIGNPTDQYIFRIRSGFLRIVRRSTISFAGKINIPCIAFILISRESFLVIPIRSRICFAASIRILA